MGGGVEHGGERRQAPLDHKPVGARLHWCWIVWHLCGQPFSTIWELSHPNHSSGLNRRGRAENWEQHCAAQTSLKKAEESEPVQQLKQGGWWSEEVGGHQWGAATEERRRTRGGAEE